MTTTLKRFTTTLSFTLAAAMTALPAMAEVCTPSYSTSSASYAQPAYASSYTPAYSTSYAPSYAPAFSSYSTQYGTQFGCPAYGNGQWVWNGYNWMWCPANAYAPFGLSFFDQVSPNADLSFGFGGYPYGAAYFSTPYAPSNYATPSYYGAYPYAASYPFVSTGGSMVIVNHRVVRVIRGRDRDDRHIRDIRPFAARHRFVARHEFVTRHTFVARHRFVERRSFFHQTRMAHPRMAPRAVRSNHRPPRG